MMLELANTAEVFKIVDKMIQVGISDLMTDKPDLTDEQARNILLMNLGMRPEFKKIIEDADSRYKQMKFFDIVMTDDPAESRFELCEHDEITEFFREHQEELDAIAAQRETEMKAALKYAETVYVGGLGAPKPWEFFNSSKEVSEESKARLRERR